MFKSINPYNQSVIAEFEPLNDSALQKKLNLATAAYKDWRRESFSKRAQLLINAAKLMRQNKEEYARITTLEMGKAINVLVVLTTMHNMVSVFWQMKL